MNGWLSTTSHWGAYRARVGPDGELDVAPHPADRAPSELLGNVASSVRHETRVARPAIRRGWLENGPGPSDLRGREEFVEVGWDTALDLVAAELRRVREQHGNQAIFGGSYGWASAGRFHHAQSQLHRFLNTIGGYTSSRNSYSLGTSLVLLPHLVGDADTYLRRADGWDTIRRHTDLVVAFGGLPPKNVSVTPGGVTRHTSSEVLADWDRSGVDLDVVSPLATDLPDSRRARWTRVRPATDVALILGLAHVVLTEGLHDQEFLDRCTTGFDEFAGYLLGEGGPVRDAEWASAVCGVPADDIRDLARRMAAGRTLITVSWSLQRIEHGEQPVWAALALAAMLGGIGLPGGGFGHGYGSIGDVGDTGPLLPLPTLPQGANPVSEFIPVARISDLLLHPGEEFDYDGRRLTYPDIRAVYWAGGNPFHHHQDLNRLRRAFGRPDTVIVHEPHWTATARHADVVLPVTTTLEREDIGGGRRDTHLIAMRRILDPVGQARDDHDVFRGLAERLGAGSAFTADRTPREWLAHLYGQWRAALAGEGHEVPAFEEFWRAGELALPARPQSTPLAEFRADPRSRPLATPSGRIELFSARIAGFGLPGLPGYPVWREPVEGLDHDRFPLRLIAHQPRTRLHGQGDVGDVSRADKVHGREPIRLHPDDAAARGIADGTVVRVFNDRGACLAGARLTTDVLPGVAVLATGAWYDPVDDPAQPGGSLCVHGNPNVLTADRPTSPLSQGCSGQQARVEVEPGPSEPPPLSCLHPPRLVPEQEGIR
ncbi:molybdopterin guanine dinucleotide-containing S/N-oxide reductase [Saccharopolyspora gloriosae]|uniref:Biotin/methionine sulfoxide reductase n=1 Tax=Saccharopolyspora gloriosae TaxID=455344 RepID=A0A840NGA0_9PSEU|nr:molybdopterin-dependent oxidoreductase [Saccharopolyspora gloriosae]MBB5069273.1 biotin/methionine sulfoxide reductase [Saccharopolyspora gloriosae]